MDVFNAPLNKNLGKIRTYVEVHQLSGVPAWRQDIKQGRNKTVS